MAVKKMPEKSAVKKAPGRKSTKVPATKPFTRGDAYVCEVCGLAVVIDTECDCVGACEIICCEQPMKPRKTRSTKAAKVAAS